MVIFSYFILVSMALNSDTIFHLVNYHYSKQAIYFLCPSVYFMSSLYN